jgi:hypothetical protein
VSTKYDKRKQIRLAPKALRALKEYQKQCVVWPSLPTLANTMILKGVAAELERKP